MSNPIGEPFAEESDLYHFITQETRYLILQYVLAHPENLPSLEELDYAIPKGKSTIHEHLRRLRDRGIVDAYELDSEERNRDLPSTFYGLTEYGIHVVEEFDLLEAKGMLQAIYANMDKPDRIQRYEEAPRPERKSEDELREELDELVEGEESIEQPATARKVLGISNLIGEDSTGVAGVDDSAAVRLELGTGILNLLESDSTEDREAAVSALAGIAKVDADVVAPVLSKLSEIVGDLGMEGQLEVSGIFQIVSGEDSNAVSEEALERLSEVYERDLDYWQADLELAREVLETGLAVGVNSDAESLQATCYEGLGHVARRRGDLDGAEQYHEESLAIEREVGDRHGEATSLKNLGNVVLDRGDLNAAETHYEESLTILREVGDRHGEAKSLGNLGNVAIQRGDLEAAKEYYEQSLTIEREIGDRHGEAKSLGNLGLVARQRGDLEAAETHHEESHTIFREMGDRHGEATSLHNLGVVARQRGDLEAAQKYIEQSLAIEREMGARHGEAKSLGNLGVVARQRGDLEAAEEYHEQSLAIEREVGDRHGESNEPS